jgi:hypothetical protein
MGSNVAMAGRIGGAEQFFSLFFCEFHFGMWRAFPLTFSCPSWLAVSFVFLIYGTNPASRLFKC